MKLLLLSLLISTNCFAVTCPKGDVESITAIHSLTDFETECISKKKYKKKLFLICLESISESLPTDIYNINVDYCHELYIPSWSDPEWRAFYKKMSTFKYKR